MYQFHYRMIYKLFIVMFVFLFLLFLSLENLRGRTTKKTLAQMGR